MNPREVGESKVSDILRVRNTPFKKPNNMYPLAEKEEGFIMKLFHRKSKAIKKWRSRAWSIDPNKTNLTIEVKKDKLSQHVPPWIYRKGLLPT